MKQRGIFRKSTWILAGALARAFPLVLALVLALGSALSSPAEALAQASSGGGSWGQINQPVERPANWTALVPSSPFVLGGRTQAGEANGQPLYVQEYGSYPSIDGSTVCVPLAMELARQLLGMEEGDLQGFVTFSTTHNAYLRLIGRQANPSSMIMSQNAAMEDQRPVDLMIGTEPSEEELRLAADAGVKLVKVPICYDAFVFLVHGKNPVKSLTVSQIQQIYVGQIMNWREVGGQDVQIFPFQREANSGSQTAMENLVMKGVALTAALPNYVTEGMGDLIRKIGDYDNGPASLGYSYLYYVENLYKSGDVKVLAVDGVQPSADNLRSRKYPFTTCYYAVYREGDALAQGFAEWLAGDVGQQVVRQAGYVPVGE